MALLVCPVKSILFTSKCHFIMRYVKLQIGSPCSPPPPPRTPCLSLLVVFHYSFVRYLIFSLCFSLFLSCVVNGLLRRLRHVLHISFKSPHLTYNSYPIYYLPSTIHLTITPFIWTDQFQPPRHILPFLQPSVRLLFIMVLAKLKTFQTSFSSRQKS